MVAHGVDQGRTFQAHDDGGRRIRLADSFGSKPHHVGKLRHPRRVIAPIPSASILISNVEIGWLVPDLVDSSRPSERGRNPPAITPECIGIEWIRISRMFAEQ